MLRGYCRAETHCQQCGEGNVWESSHGGAGECHSLHSHESFQLAMKQGSERRAQPRPRWCHCCGHSCWPQIYPLVWNSPLRPPPQLACRSPRDRFLSISRAQCRRNGQCDPPQTAPSSPSQCLAHGLHMDGCHRHLWSVVVKALSDPINGIDRDAVATTPLKQGRERYDDPPRACRPS